MINNNNIKYKFYNLYPIWKYLDIFMFLSILLLFICYFCALFLGHIGLFCDISDLGINMPERVLFRFDLSIMGSILMLISLPIHDVISIDIYKYKILKKKKKKFLSNIAYKSQIISGTGIIFVGACNPKESLTFHLFAAICAFGGSFITQFIYNILLYYQDNRKLYMIRCIITSLFFICFILFILGEIDIIPEPFEHILEWILMFNLVLWYSLFRYDFNKFYITLTTA